MKLAPVLILAAVLAVFMTLDKLTLHWYAPDTSKPSLVGEAARVNANSATATAATSPVSVNESPTPGTAPEIRDAFIALWVAGQRTTYRVRYETRSDGGAAGDSYVIFNSPPLARVDVVGPGEREPSSQLLVDTTGATIACSPGPSGRQCAPVQAFASPLPLAAGPILFPEANTFSSLSVIEVYPRTIAGIVARCFQLPSDDRESTTEYCFTADGVPVYANGPFGVVEASDLSSDVSSSDFQTP